MKPTSLLRIPAIREDHLIGHGVALSGDGNMLVIGAMGESSAATGIDGDQIDNSASDTGAVYVFR